MFRYILSRIQCFFKYCPLRQFKCDFEARNGNFGFILTRIQSYLIFCPLHFIHHFHRTLLHWSIFIIDFYWIKLKLFLGKSCASTWCLFFVKSSECFWIVVLRRQWSLERLLGSNVAFVALRGLFFVRIQKSCFTIHF